MFGIRQVSGVEATANAFGMWTGKASGASACLTGTKLVILALRMLNRK